MMMRQCQSDDPISNTLGYNQHQFEEQPQPNGLPYANNTMNNANLMPPPQMSQQHMFDSPQEMNRRTLTQEAFDLFAQNGGMMEQPGQIDGLHQGFSSNADFQQVFSDMDQHDFKDDGTFSFPAPMTAPLSSNDSSIPSTISEQNLFPSSTAMQEHAALSATTSDWTDSRSSSVSNSDTEDPYPMMVASQQQTTSSQWQPGQSVPVDVNDLHQQFQGVERQAQQQHLQQQPTQPEHPMAWPCDEKFVRRDSQNGMALAQQMSSIGIQTPQPQQNATFKSPTPPQGNGGSLAARRQRPRPAPIGVTSVRSQSYSGAVQPASPNHQTQNIAGTQQGIRRIRSSNVINGVAQGRVMKSTPGSAQRSPMHFTFDQAMEVNQRNASASCASASTLAPPTPLSPSARQDQARPQFPPWQSSSNFNRQASISELDPEHKVTHTSTASGQSHNFTSPPQTPMYHHHHHQMGHRIGSTVITENTPPQSAPAVQTTFPAHAFMPPPPQPMQSQSQAPSVQFQQSQQAFSTAPGQHFVNMPVPEQQFQMSAPQYAPAAQFVVASDSAPQLSIPFGIPAVNSQGLLTTAYMQQLQFVSQSPGHPPQASQQYSFVPNAGTSSGMHVTSQPPKQNSQPIIFHEYSPPSDVKRAATPRKAASEGGPKNFSFTNHTSEDFGKSKAKKAEAKSGTGSSSPGSSSS